VGQIISACPEFDPNLLIGVIVRFAISGHIELDLSIASFNYGTLWNLNEETANEVE